MVAATPRADVAGRIRLATVVMRADTPHVRPARSKRYRPTFTRNELSLLLDGMNAVIEEFKYDGGLNLAEEYIRLAERLRKLMGLPV